MRIICEALKVNYRQWIFWRKSVKAIFLLETEVAHTFDTAPSQRKCWLRWHPTPLDPQLNIVWETTDKCIHRDTQIYTHLKIQQVIIQNVCDLFLSLLNSKLC